MSPAIRNGQEAKTDLSYIVSLFGQSSYVYENTWAPIAASVVLGFGKLNKALVDALVQDLLQRSEATSEKEVGDVTPQRLAVFRALREGFLKGAALAGFPRVINALNYLQSSLVSHAPAIATVLKQDTSIRTPIPRAERQSRGWAFFSSVYGQHAERLFSSLNENSGGDLGEFALNTVYADLVSEISILGAKETELLQFVCCLSLGLDCAPQAKGKSDVYSHMHGARTMGNSGEEIRAAIRTVEYLSAVFDMPWQREEMPFLDKAGDW